MYDQNELYRHGILGQRWGVRRFQNPDGTRTTAGKKRERESDEGSKKHIGRKIAIGVGTALAIGGAAYAISTGKVNVGNILQNFGSTPVSSVPKKPSEATLAVLDANKQYKTKMLLKKHETSRAIVAANKKMKEEAARKVAEEAAKNNDKVLKKAHKSVAKDMKAFNKELSKLPGYLNADGRVSKKAINAYNRHMADLMNKRVTDIHSPSGKVARFIALRGEVGVQLALATPGYDLGKVSKGVYGNGRVAYRKNQLAKIDI